MGRIDWPFHFSRYRLPVLWLVCRWTSLGGVLIKLTGGVRVLNLGLLNVGLLALGLLGVGLLVVELLGLRLLGMGLLGIARLGGVWAECLWVRRADIIGPRNVMGRYWESWLKPGTLPMITGAPGSVWIAVIVVLLSLGIRGGMSRVGSRPSLGRLAAAVHRLVLVHQQPSEQMLAEQVTYESLFRADSVSAG